MQQAGFKLNVWDFGGQKHIRPYWKNYYQNTDCVIYMVDSVDKRRTDEAAEELVSLAEPVPAFAPIAATTSHRIASVLSWCPDLAQMSLLEEEELKSVAVLVFANKQDLLGAMSAAEVMKELELTSLKDRWVHVQARGAPP